MLAEMREKGIEIDLILLFTTIKGFVKNGYYADAIRVLHEMKVIYASMCVRL